MDKKQVVFRTLVIYMSTLGTRSAPYLSQTLELVVPNLRFICTMGSGRLVPCTSFTSFLHSERGGVKVLRVLMLAG